MLPVIRSMLPLLGALLALPAHAEAPWGTIDAHAAQSLHDKACAGCHARMYSGDGSAMYTRDGRQLSTRLEVLQRVAACNSTMNSGWFPEEEANVAGWLNERYYHFKQ